MISLKKRHELLNEKIQNVIDAVTEEESSRLQKALSGMKFEIRIFDTYQNTSKYFPASLVQIGCSPSHSSYDNDVEYHFSAEFSFRNPKNGRMEIESVIDLESSFIYGKVKIVKE